MPLDDIQTGIEDLNPTNPTGSDPKSEGDDHLRDIKLALSLSFPNTSGAWNTTDEIECGGIDAGNNPVTGVSNPAGQTDAVNLGYLQGLLNAQRVSWGAFGSNGGIGNSPGSGDYSVQQISTGLYEITFTVAPLVDDFNQTVVAVPLSTGLNRFCAVELIAGTGLVVRIHVKDVKNAPAYVDSGVAFIRIV